MQRNLTLLLLPYRMTKSWSSSNGRCDGDTTLIVNLPTADNKLGATD
jgi:hypothetical protein